MIREYKPIDNLTNNPDWLAIEVLLLEKIDELSDISEIDLELSPEELKIELKARARAKEKLQIFYDENRFTKPTPTESNVSFK